MQACRKGGRHEGRQAGMKEGRKANRKEGMIEGSHAGRKEGSHTCREASRHACREASRKAGMQAGMQAGRKASRQEGRKEACRHEGLRTYGHRSLLRPCTSSTSTSTTPCAGYIVRYGSRYVQSRAEGARARVATGDTSTVRVLYASTVRTSNRSATARDCRARTYARTDRRTPH